MHVDQQVIDLATGIQRRRDFTAHVTGFAAGAVVMSSLNLAGVRGPSPVYRDVAHLGDCPFIPALPSGPARPGHRWSRPR